MRALLLFVELITVEISVVWWLANVGPASAFLNGEPPSMSFTDSNPLINELQLEKNELLFSRINRELRELNRLGGAKQWWSMVGEPTDPQEAQLTVETRTVWRNKWCSELLPRLQTAFGDLLTVSQKRQVYLLCRGPKYTPSQTRELMLVLNELEDQYVNIRVCRGPQFSCYNIEPDLERLMKTSKDPAELLWAWQESRSAIGPPSKMLYPVLIDIQNKGAQNNGYSDIGVCWREELETDGLEEVVEDLFLEVRPLYRKLHAYVRFRLSDIYNFDSKDLIPAHLLGNMWAQNWDSLLPLLVNSSLDLEAAFQAKKYKVEDMLRHAEDFYLSLGMEKMSPQFWSRSQVLKPNRTSSCHATAANMYNDDDFRLLMCAQVSLEDFYVIHHEMGHIQYYMSYKDQPTIFQEGANSAFQEAVGDAVMLGVMSPQHLERLGILDLSLPLSDVDATLLLRMALNKLPQLTFGLVVDKWRWAVMRGAVDPSHYNRAWWALHAEYLGVRPPTTRSDADFDPAIKFHIIDNTPYIRYYIGVFLQMQFLESMCRAALPDNRTDILHRCDIYGSSQAGLLLKNMMRLGSSMRWQEALRVASDGTYSWYSTKPLLKYFKPLEKWLDLQISQHQIPVWFDSESE